MLLLFFSTNLLVGADAIPTINLSLSAPDSPEQLVTSLNLLVVLTILVLAPSMVFIGTSFLRLIVVFLIFTSSSWNSADASKPSFGFTRTHLDIFYNGANSKRCL